MRLQGRRTVEALLLSLLLAELLPCPATHCQTGLDQYQAVLDTLMLSRIANLDFHPEYGLLIADSRERAIWRISPDGEVARLQALGQGPGEYTGLIAVKWGPGGTICIAGNSRVLVYSHSLEYQGWFGPLMPWDVEVTEDGRLYVALRMGPGGPVAMIDSRTHAQVAVTDWRDSEALMGIPGDRAVSNAVIEWSSEKKLLFICYKVDGWVEVVSGSKVTRTFQIASEAVKRSVSEMRQANRTGKGVVINIALMSFTLLDDGNLLFSLGGELILATDEGHVLQRAPWPEGYRQFYAGPVGHVFAINSATNRVESILLSDLFPNCADK